MAAMIARIATMQTTSIKVKPASASLSVSADPARDIGRRACSTFLPIRTVGDHVVVAVLAGRAIEVRLAPGIGGHHTALQVWPVPSPAGAAFLHQRGQALRGRRIAAVVEKIQIERAGKALDLDLRGLGFRFAEVVED